MASGAKLATAYYELIPSMAGAQQKITSQLLPAVSGAGAAAGTSLGSTILGGLSAFAAPIAALVVGFSVKKLISDSIDSFNSLTASVNSLQRIAGGTKEEVSGLRAALQLSGIDSDQASASLTIFSKNLGNAANDSEKAAELTAKMGVSFLDAAGNVRPMAQILPGLSDTFRSMPDGAEKTALAVQLFGRSGTQLLPFLNKGSAGIADLTAKAAQMGLVIDDISAKTFADARVSTRNFQATIQGLQTTLGGNLLPVVGGVQNIFRNALTPVILSATAALQRNRESFLAAGESINTFAIRVGTAVKSLLSLAITGDFTPDIGKALGISEDSPVLAAILTFREALSGVFSGLKSAFGPVIDSIGAAFSQLAPVFAPLIPQLFELVQAFSPLGLIFQAVLPVLPQLTDVFIQLGSALAGALSSGFSVILPVVTKLVGVLSTSLLQVISTLLPVVVKLATILGDTLGKAIVTLVPIIGQIDEALGDVLVSVITAIVPIIGTLAELFGTLLTAVAPLIGPLLGLLTPILQLIAPLVQLVATILTPLVSLLTVILTPIIQLVGVIVQLLIPAIQGQITVMTFVIEVIVNVITWLVNLITMSIEAQLKIVGAFGEIYQTFVDFFANSIGGFVDFISSVIGAVSGFVSTVIRGFSILWDTATGTFSSGINTVIGFFTSLPDQILGAIGGLGDLLYNSAQSIIQGFIDGFTDSIGAVGDAVGGIMDFVGGFFPRSPAKRGPFSGSGWAAIKEAGVAIGDQFSLGLTATEPGVNSRLDSILNPPVVGSGINPALTTVSNSGVGNAQATVTQNITFGPEADYRLAIRQVGREAVRTLAAI